MQDSKAKLIEDVTKQLKATYEGQLQNLNDRLRGVSELSEKQIALKQEQIEGLQRELAQKKGIPLVVWLLIVFAVVIGILIGKGCN